MDGWVESALGDVLSVLRNGINCKQDKSKKGDKVSRIESISESKFNLNKVGYTELSEHDKKKYRLQSGDVLFSHINSPIHVGKTAIFDNNEPVYHGVNLLLMRPKTIMLPAFLDLALKQLYLNGYWRNICKQSVNQASVNQQDISQIKIRYPKSIGEQQRIVAILDEAFEGIFKAKANAEKNLLNARELFEGYLQSVFTQRGEGWLETTIGENIKFIDYRGKTPKKTKEGLRLITAKNVKMGYLQDHPREYISPEDYDSWMVRGIPQAGDVLFTTEAPLANVAQLDTDEKVVFAQRIIIMQPDSKVIDNTFLKYILMSPIIQERIHSKGTGATVKGIKAKLLKAIAITFPRSLDVQREIVRKIDLYRDETHHLESIYTKKIAALEELKKSLLDQAFTGKL